MASNSRTSSIHLESSDISCTVKDALLQKLPPELMRHVYAFMDIPMLGAMAQVHTGHLRRLACDDQVWGPLVKRRFGISPHTTKRPKSLGGKDWKDAYRSMHLCHRIPKCRSTARKAIFAKFQHMGHTKSSMEPLAAAGTGGLSVWVGVNHTDNCRTRILRTTTTTTAAAAAENGNGNDDNNDDTNNDTTPSRRYVDFWVCLQNPQSNGPVLQAHVLQSTLQFLGGRGDLYAESCLQEELYTACGGYRWMAPRWIYKQPQQQQHNQTRASSAHIPPPPPSLVEEDISQGISLQPMEFCVVSIPFECGPDVYETDVLARTVTLQIPFSSIPTDVPGSVHDDNRVAARRMPVEGSSTWLPAMRQSVSSLSIATAWFVGESDIWDQYCALPGGCLTLSDRDRRIHL